ncbi:MAG TPA: hypothetical protein VEA59_02425 [Patescibacteria group bacterium]|nr:hypothetical protein [Patescibacteria group bacterium]
MTEQQLNALLGFVFTTAFHQPLSRKATLEEISAAKVLATSGLEHKLRALVDAYPTDDDLKVPINRSLFIFLKACELGVAERVELGFLSITGGGHMYFVRLVSADDAVIRWAGTAQVRDLLSLCYDRRGVIVCTPRDGNFWLEEIRALLPYVL